MNIPLDHKYHAYGFTNDDGSISFVKIEMFTETVQIALDIVPAFQKSLKVRATELTAGDRRYGIVSIQAGLNPNGVRGQKNESGLARLRKFVKTVMPGLDFICPWQHCLNQATEQQLKAVLL